MMILLQRYRILPTQKSSAKSIVSKDLIVPELAFEQSSSLRRNKTFRSFPARPAI